MIIAREAQFHPPGAVVDRLMLVAALEEVLGVEKVREVLGGFAWFARVEVIRVKARKIKEAKP